MPLPIAQRSWTRPVTSIHQIEIAGGPKGCNLRCVYCPIGAKTFTRDDGLMEEAVFDRALELAKHYARKGTQGELNLAGIGESTIHPQFVEWVLKARAALPHHQITFATNGIRFDEEMAKAIAPAKPRVWLSLHRPEKAMKAKQAAEKYGLLVAALNTPVTAPISWAGQVKDWPVDVPGMQDRPCPWLQSGAVMVLVDGRISHCCLDASGVGVVGHVMDEPDTMMTKDSALCSTCHYSVPQKNDPTVRAW